MDWPAAFGPFLPPALPLLGCRAAPGWPPYLRSTPFDISSMQPAADDPGTERATPRFSKSPSVADRPLAIPAKSAAVA